MIIAFFRRNIYTSYRKYTIPHRFIVISIVFTTFFSHIHYLPNLRHFIYPAMKVLNVGIFMQVSEIPILKINRIR